MRHPLACFFVFCLACTGDPKALSETGSISDEVLDTDGDGYNADEDCDDYNSLVHPGATELCDGFDNDCDGTVDEDVTTSYYADRDRDGFGDAGDVTEACSQPAGYVPNGNDCNDDAATAYPGGEEVCDGLDNNCNGTIDEGVGAAYYADADSDGFGDPDAVFFSCEPVSGYVSDSSDCDDTDDSSYPGGEEVCDGADNNCNGTIDEGVTSTFYVDTDADSYGVADKTAEACARPTGFAEVPGDCDDTVPAVNPDAMEVCDDIDNDCDGTIDEDDALDATTWYADSDSDGYGDADHPTVACDAPSGTVPDNSDCDDGTISTNPAADEYCDDVDNDCDGDVDEDDALDATTWYADSDSDGFGGTVSLVQCDQPSGYVSDSTDCDDGSSNNNPDADELCDGVDNDCDRDIDEDDALDAATWYADSDSDGFGDAGAVQEACEQPSGFVSDDKDCDDGVGTVNPGADEYCDEIDNDCDGNIDEDDALDADLWYADTDADGFGDPDEEVSACTLPSGYVEDDSDCDDNKPTTNPDASSTVMAKMMTVMETPTRTLSMWRRGTSTATEMATVALRR